MREREQKGANGEEKRTWEREVERVKVWMCEAKYKLNNK